MSRNDVVRVARDWLAEIDRKQRELDAERKEAERALAAIGRGVVAHAERPGKARAPKGWARDHREPLLRFAVVRGARGFTNGDVVAEFCPGRSNWPHSLIYSLVESGYLQITGGTRGRGGRQRYGITAAGRAHVEEYERLVAGVNGTGTDTGIVAARPGESVEPVSRM